MIALWMLYGVLLSLSLAAAARCAETILHLHRKPARLVWAGALFLSLTVPLAVRVSPRQPAPATFSTSVAEPGLVRGLLPSSLEGMWERVGAAILGKLGAWDAALLSIWVLASLGLVLLFGLSLARVRRMVRGWPTCERHGESVRVSPSFGPALVGVLCPEIVVPWWVLKLDEATVDLVLRHELEHRRGRDTALLAAGLLAVIVAPLNLVLWWQLHRLRMAVEMDCDLRVLRDGASRRVYGQALLEVGGRMTGVGIWSPALSEPKSFLERRMTMITQKGPSRRAGKVMAAALLGGALLAVACETPTPTALSPVAAKAALQQASETAQAQGQDPRVAKSLVRLGQDGEPLILVDGQRVTKAQLDGLEPAAIQRIEVIKPPASLQTFGEEGAHGVIQIFMKGTR